MRGPADEWAQESVFAGRSSRAAVVGRRWEESGSTSGGGDSDWEQGTGNREQGTGNREQGTGNREQGTGNRTKKQQSIEISPMVAARIPALAGRAGAVCQNGALDAYLPRARPEKSPHRRSLGSGSGIAFGVEQRLARTHHRQGVAGTVVQDVEKPGRSSWDDEELPSLERTNELTTQRHATLTKPGEIRCQLLDRPVLTAESSPADIADTIALINSCTSAWLAELLELVEPAMAVLAELLGRRSRAQGRRVQVQQIFLGGGKIAVSEVGAELVEVADKAAQAARGRGDVR